MIKYIYKVTAECFGLKDKKWSFYLNKILEEFSHRAWQKNLTAIVKENSLILSAENDYDSDGFAFVDEFSDVISACVDEKFNGDIKILSVTKIDQFLGDSRV